MNWRALIGVVLLAAAIFSAWSAWDQRKKEAPTLAETDRSDYVMYDFEMVALDKQGKESVSLRAPEMHREPADETYRITTPLFLVPNAEGQHWHVTSQTGWVSAKGDELRLLKDVKGVSPSAMERPSSFETQRLNIFPQKNLAVTDQVVRMSQPGATLTGRGFETNLETGQYTLKSQVRTRYEPNSR
ncbi:LPS export ABC transporter periplasmic protein LptC [Pseudoxanthomonas dokdonensis]|uniref:Lipopolysaccharide export system protein LptC n=1 Tax=Pseudoxanthomonas dokdonensis TaxID=344882 RepID=A0A0R0CG03_9GAMM|nr:LPS export ABC transporter periplasmic protein LptC [Pseudoxanthomonas dokdonensis]KRG67974.1 hypothetical protein ABB29_14425 [Pseudoxanthomonas dokdonensis]